MSDSYFKESSMSDSFIYGLFNASGEIQTRILKALKEGMVLTESFIQEQMIQIEKTHISPLAPKVMKAFGEGRIRLVYWNTPTQKMTKTIPFIIHKSNIGVVASIFVGSYGKLVADNTQLQMPMKDLYILMEAAYLALNFQERPMIFKRNATIMKICNDVYVDMFLKLLNRDYALSLDIALNDRVAFCISKFFLERVWESTYPEVVYNYAVQTTVEKHFDDLKLLNEEYNAHTIENISDLFEFLKSLTPKMADLKVRYFVERFINTYGSSSILAIDYLPYLIFLIDNTIIGGFLVPQNTISDIIKNTKDIRKFWVELAKLL